MAAETRNRELAERDSLNYAGQVRELRAEKRPAQEELGRTRVEADNAKSRLETTREPAARRRGTAAPQQRIDG
ncbi:MAG: hypothetical protein IPM25_06430 [Chloracidobacterium sp.]|nr:hypothetical protein [Chloracidobacterium sp.]